MNSEVTIRHVEPTMPGASIPPRKGLATQGRKTMTARYPSVCPRCAGDISTGDTIYAQGYPNKKWVCQSCSRQALR